MKHPFELVAKAKKNNPELTAEDEAGLKVVEDAINEHFKGAISQTELDAKISEAQSSMKSKYDELLENARAQAVVIDQLKSMGIKSNTPQDLSLKGQIASWLSAPKPEGTGAKSNKEKFEAFKKGEINRLEFEVKAAGTMLVSTNATLADPFLPAPEVMPGYVDLVRTQPLIRNYVTNRPTSAPSIYWVEKVNPDGTCAFIGEGVLKPLIDFDWKKNTSAAKKVADKIKVSTEMLDDIDFMASAIRDELMYQVDIVEDGQLLTGDGTGANLKGIDEYAGGYVLTTILTATPNLADCIMACAVQIKTLNFNANVALVNPVDAANLQLEKTTEGMYLIPPFKSANGTTIAGITVVECNNVAVGTLRVYDSTKAMYRPYENFTVAYGWVNDDFEKNLVTVIGEKRVHFYIAENHYGAFVSDTIANIKTAITAPGI